MSLDGCNMSFDISDVNKKILEILDKHSVNLNRINSDIKKFKKILESDCGILINVKNDINNKIFELEKYKEYVDKILKDKDFYVMEYSELVKVYNDMKIKSNIKNKRISFMGKKSLKTKDDNDTTEMNEKFLEILKKYNYEFSELDAILNYNNLKKNSNTVTKPIKTCECGSIIFITNTENNTEICEKCGNIENKENKTINYKDTSRLNLSNKYFYERVVHFREVINQFQGKQNASIDAEVYKNLEEQLSVNGILLKNKSGKERFLNVTRDHIYFFLKQTDNTKHYEDIVLIYHTLTGKKVPDISHLETKLIKDFERISDLYDKKFKLTGRIKRKSFINTQYILYQLLRTYKFDCTLKDFSMLKTLDRLSQHDTIVSEIFSELGLSFFPVF